MCHKVRHTTCLFLQCSTCSDNIKRGGRGKKNRFKWLISALFNVSEKQKTWCCKRELNSRPLPYQGSALPLSYCSVPRCLNQMITIWCGRFFAYRFRICKRDFEKRQQFCEFDDNCENPVWQKHPALLSDRLAYGIKAPLLKKRISAPKWPHCGLSWIALLV